MAGVARPIQLRAGTDPRTRGAGRRHRQPRQGGEAALQAAGESMSDTPEPEPDPDPDPLRPRDFALLLLASGDLAPRQRARDQQADRAGLELKRQVLDSLAARDPEADDLEAALLAIVEDLGPPTGPT